MTKFWVFVPCIWFEIRINYQLDAIEYLFVYFSSTCFGLICPSSGAMDVTISFTYAAYVKEIVTSIAREDGHISPKLVELKYTNKYSIASSW